MKDEAYSYIIDLINEGKIKYGEIYFINDIAAELNMSRTPVRDAIQRLGEENRIDILPSRGFRLHYLTEDEIVQLFNFSSAIEGYCAARLAETYKSQGHSSYVVQLGTLVKKMHSSDLEHISFKEFYFLDNEFHRVLISSLEDNYFINLNDAKKGFPDRPELHLIKNFISRSDILQAHQRILDAICSGDSGKAFLAMLSHADMIFRCYKSNKNSSSNDK
ncbi:GntR family transcriptional regulator [Desulfitobacterium hafniense]|uniref:GntR family transcriptional regulator n=1 Tax=Desulfitobacterium hafniense TaxID=49338 RepID=UPI002B1F12FD|nr:GntR family transcriptional regulator [Desulfitobacterium hafniense]